VSEYDTSQTSLFGKHEVCDTAVWKFIKQVGDQIGHNHGGDVQKLAKELELAQDEIKHLKPQAEKFEKYHTRTLEQVKFESNEDEMTKMGEVDIFHS
jgi:hypothetical protein